MAASPAPANPVHGQLTPQNCTVIFIDYQPQMAFAVTSIERLPARSFGSGLRSNGSEHPPAFARCQPAIILGWHSSRRSVVPEQILRHNHFDYLAFRQPLPKDRSAYPPYYVPRLETKGLGVCCSQGRLVEHKH